MVIGVKTLKKLKWQPDQNATKPADNTSGLDFNRLSPDEVVLLEEPFSEAEVWSAIKDCGSSKAPRPHGFNLRFYKKFLLRKYANDTIFFGEWCENNIRNLFKLLKCLELTSGLKVNYVKSNLFEVSVDRSEVENMARIFGCNVGCSIDSLGIVFRDSFTRYIGNGLSTSFWNDLWLGNFKLKNRFKRLTHLEADLAPTVGDRLRWDETNWTKTDGWKCSLAGNEIFKTKILSDVIDSKLLHTGTTIRTTLRNNLVPKKVEVFVWRVRRGRLPVMVELDKRGIDQHSVCCPICDNDIESLYHSLLSCSIVKELWATIFDWWGLNRYTNTNVNDLLQGNSSNIGSNLGKKVWQAVIWTCGYLIWKN
ncbi:uncharacterized protein [Rutidosis leptorrhynchoides]|uniref:uncharacterized protein n=1 Tax=Rutidosis leptorrhynchoides TaxID=125765 RepID=UPI003A992D6B